MSGSERVFGKFLLQSLLVLGVGALAACSPGKAPAPIEKNNVDTPSGGVIPAYQLDALKKAQGVEDMADQHRKDMENQGL